MRISDGSSDVCSSNLLAPTLATGNTAVVKPSEHASASTLEFGRLIEKAGFPAGVVNIVTGDGRIGAPLTTQPRVRKISFTGGLSTAQKILQSAAATDRKSTRLNSSH